MRRWIKKKKNVPWQAFSVQRMKTGIFQISQKLQPVKKRNTTLLRLTAQKMNWREQGRKRKKEKNIFSRKLKKNRF